MERLIEAQGRQAIHYQLGRHTHEVLASHAGRVESIDCAQIARIARLAGAPMDKGAGIDLLHKVGAPVRQHEPLYRIHASSETGLGFARALAQDASGYGIAA